MSLFIIRHGETDWNKEEKVHGRTDVNLNKKGIQQAEKASILIQDEKIDIIICSPLTRAKQTAEIINKDKNIKIIFDNRIIERDFGEFEGLKRSEFEQDNFWSYKKNIKYKKAENIREFFERIYNFLNDIEEKYKDKNVLIVAHGGISIVFNSYYNGIPENDKLIKKELKNCEIEKYN